MSDIHLPNFYSDEEWNDLSGVQREQSSQAYRQARDMEADELRELIASIEEEIEETPIEGSYDLWHIEGLRRELDDLRGMLELPEDDEHEPNR